MEWNRFLPVSGAVITLLGDDAELYNRERYPKVNEILRPMLETAPNVQTFNVNISTTHKIAASKAAARACQPSGTWADVAGAARGAAGTQRKER